MKGGTLFFPSFCMIYYRKKKQPLITVLGDIKKLNNLRKNQLKFINIDECDF
jgi:hypothetical protein